MGYSFHLGSPVNPNMNKNQSSDLETLSLTSFFFLERQPALREGLGCKRNWDMGGAGLWEELGRRRSWDVGEPEPWEELGCRVLRTLSFPEGFGALLNPTH